MQCLGSIFLFNFFLPVQKYLEVEVPGVHKCFLDGKLDLILLLLIRMIFKTNYQDLPILGSAVDMLTSSFLKSAIPMHLYFKNYWPEKRRSIYVDKSQKLWKPAPLFTYLHLVRVCRIML